MKEKKRPEEGFRGVGAVAAIVFMLLAIPAYARAVEPQVAAGVYHTVGLKSDGTVVAVGNNYNGQLNVGSWRGIVQVAAVEQHTVGLKSDGTVVAVGDNKHEQLNVTSWRGISQVAAGWFHTVGLKLDGTVVAVGGRNLDEGQLNVGSWTGITQVAAGYWHTLGLKSDGTVVGTGSNYHGQVDVGSWEGITCVAAGSGHTVGLRSNGTVVAVGYNGYGQLDVGSWEGITQVVAGAKHTVGVKSDGTVVAVGDNTYGQLDVGSWTGITRVAVGENHTVGLRSDGTVVTIGSNEYGQLYVGSWEGIAQVATGENHTVGLRSDGTVVTIGYNEYGQLDVGSWEGIAQVATHEEHTVGLRWDGTVVAVGDNSYDKLNVDSWEGITQVAAGWNHTVGLKSDGTVVAVGCTQWGERDVSSWDGIAQVAAGSRYTVGLKSDGTVVAVGNNSYGKLNVDSWEGITQVAAGWNHTVGLKSDGTVVAVGDNSYGQLNVGSWEGVIQVVAGFYHTVGLKFDGTVVAVGDNSYGQLNVGSWEGIAQVATLAYHTGGLKSDGTVVAVGLSVYGQLNLNVWLLAIPPEPSTISGVVTDAGGTPIPDVTLYLSGDAVRDATSGADGSYRFTALTEGLYIVTPHKAGYAFKPDDRTVMLGEQGVNGQDFIGTQPLGSIGQSPSSGPPGTTFSFWGDGFTPNSFVGLRFKSPDGIESSEGIRPTDADGHFAFNFTAPKDEMPGTYFWRAVDGGTGEESERLGYVIEARPGVLHRFEFSEIGDQVAKEPFTCSIQALDNTGSVVTSFNGTASLWVSGSRTISPKQVSFVDGRAQFGFGATIYQPGESVTVYCSAGDTLNFSNPFNVAPSEPVSVTLRGYVLGSYGERLPDIRVSLTNSASGASVDTQLTNESGIYEFKNVQSGKFYVWSVDDIFKECRSKPVYVDIDEGGVYTADKLVIDCEGSHRRPVILVPGVMGSTDNTPWTWSVYPRMPFNRPADPEQLQIHDPADGAGFSIGWKPLRDALSTRYKVYDCPYDWRIGLGDTIWVHDEVTGTVKGIAAYDKYLKPVIDRAIKETGWPKVDIVAHSMGGLLVRSYIQSKDYRNDIEKFAMVGTPNHGSLNIYCMREGGDPVLADQLAGNDAAGTLPARYFYTAVANELFLLRRGKPLYSDWDIGQAPEVEIPKLEIKRFVADEVRSTRVLMPTFPFLLKGAHLESITSTEHRNTWLEQLNSDPSISIMSTESGSIRTKLFASGKEETLLSFDATTSLSDLYEDGWPVGKPLKAEGDGTVLLSSASLRADNVDEDLTVSGKHSELIKTGMTQIIDFLDEGRPFRPEDKRTPLLEAESSIMLVVSIQGRAAPLVSDPAGSRCGIDDLTQTIYQEISQGQLMREGSRSGVAITGPAAGTYTVKLSGGSADQALLSVSFMGQGEPEEHQFLLYYPGAPISFSFTLDLSAKPKLSVESAPPVPQKLRTSSYDQDGSQKARLSWEAVSSSQLSGYRIYSRRDDEPILQLLASVGADTVQYATDHAWAEPLRLYTVAAVNTEGKESFLSNFAENRTVVVAGFDATPRTAGAPPLTVQFTDTSSGHITDWVWDFGDGATVQGVQSPQHTYEAYGSYTVKLSVVGEEGEDYVAKYGYIEIKEPAPVASLSSDKTEGAAPLTVQFTDTSTGSIDQRYWDFGDSTGTSEERNPSYTYSNPGTYTATLTVSGPGGSSMAKATIMVTPPEVGSLKVEISPQAAVEAGAMWRVDKGEWQVSGATIESLGAGSHTISFKHIMGWSAPVARAVAISTGEATTEAVSYEQQYGSLRVRIKPAAAVRSGVKWKVDNGSWLESGAVARGLAVGSHTISFKPASGWSTPGAETIVINHGHTSRTFTVRSGDQSSNLAP